MFFLFFVVLFFLRIQGFCPFSDHIRYADSHKANLKLPSGTQEESAVEKRRENFVCAH